MNRLCVLVACLMLLPGVRVDAKVESDRAAIQAFEEEGPAPFYPRIRFANAS